MSGRKRRPRASTSTVRPYEQLQSEARFRFWDSLVELAMRERLDNPEEQGYMLMLAGMIAARGEGIHPERLAVLVQHAIDESARQSEGALHMVRGGDA